ncbi:MAG: hypothetical protein PWQ10_301 [Patescibacteria group bacterium]|nr:hypothetical protein [Patescibacteria group bacterium]
MSLQKTDLSDLSSFIKLADSKANPKEIDLSSMLTGVDFKNQLLRNYSVLGEPKPKDLGFCLEHTDGQSMLKDGEILIKPPSFQSEDCCQYFIKLCEMIALDYDKSILNNVRFTAGRSKTNCFGVAVKRKEPFDQHDCILPFPELISLVCYYDELNQIIKGDESLLISGVEYSYYDNSCNMYIYRDKTGKFVLGLLLKGCYMPGMFYFETRPIYA